jgi:hypothetical protein
MVQPLFKSASDFQRRIRTDSSMSAKLCHNPARSESSDGSIISEEHADTAPLAIGCLRINPDDDAGRLSAVDGLAGARRR